MIADARNPLFVGDALSVLKLAAEHMRHVINIYDADEPQSFRHAAADVFVEEQSHAASA